MTRTPAPYSQMRSSGVIGFNHSSGGEDPESISAMMGESRMRARRGRRFGCAEAAMARRCPRRALAPREQSSWATTHPPPKPRRRGSGRKRGRCVASVDELAAGALVLRKRTSFRSLSGWESRHTLGLSTGRRRGMSIPHAAMRHRDGSRGGARLEYPWPSRKGGGESR